MRILPLLFIINMTFMSNYLYTIPELELACLKSDLRTLNIEMVQARVVLRQYDNMLSPEEEPSQDMLTACIRLQIDIVFGIQLKIASIEEKLEEAEGTDSR